GTVAGGDYGFGEIDDEGDLFVVQDAQAQVYSRALPWRHQAIRKHRKHGHLAMLRCPLNYARLYIFVDVDGAGFKPNKDTLGVPLPVKSGGPGSQEASEPN
ncbi:MAG: hypothetical protein Q8N47_16155, partial [Bryobacterales bacterium]|nr:hypothetical protein [Bryobacterales bacterium]